MTHPIIEKVFHMNIKFMNIRTIAYKNINKEIWISDKRSTQINYQLNINYIALNDFCKMVLLNYFEYVKT